MKSSNNLIPYQFNGKYGQHVEVDRKLTEDEALQLSHLLTHFPKVGTHLWQHKFFNCDFTKYPKELLQIAANAFDHQGNTMLGIACEKSNIECAQQLLAMKANLNQIDRSGKHALHWAIANIHSYNHNTSQEAAQIVTFLLDQKANIHVRSYENKTPLEYAENRGYTAAAKLIKAEMAKQNEIKKAMIKGAAVGFSQMIFKHKAFETFFPYLSFQDAMIIAQSSKLIYKTTKEFKDSIIKRKYTAVDNTKVPVTLSLARKNCEYMAVFGNMYREQITRIIQRHWRKKHNKTFAGKYSETLSRPLSLKFIQEPKDDIKMNYYANRINSGHFGEFNLYDVDLISHLYKALRLKLITKNNLVDALLLRGLVEQFKGEFKQYRLEEKGPLKLERISYMTETQMKQFQEEIKSLPPNDNFYFSINLPKMQLLTFLFIGVAYFQDDGFNSQVCNLYPFYLTIFEKYLHQQKISESTIQYFVNTFKDITHHFKNETTQALMMKFINSKQEAHLKEFLLTLVSKLPDLFSNSLARTALLLFLITHEKSSLREMTMLEDAKIEFDGINLHIGGTYSPIKEARNIRFLMDLLRVSEDMPSLEISPDYDPQNPESPVVCMNVMSTASFQKLQEVIFGKDAVYPFFNAGQINTRLIRYLDEIPQEYGVQQPSRPVEIVHPNLIRSKTFHGYKAFDFMGTWHDLFHAWKCSVNTFKSIIRYAIIQETTETGFDMSKTIWHLVDRDFLIAKKIRLAMKNNDAENIKKEIIESVKIILLVLGFENYGVPRTCLNLMFIIDMIVNRKKWEELAHVHPRDAAKDVYSLKLFSEIYDLMEKVIQNDYSLSNQYKSIKYYLLLFRLRNFSDAVKICDELEMIGLDNILYWKQNEGLFLKEDLQKNPRDLALEKMDSETLLLLLNKKLQMIKHQHLLNKDLQTLSLFVPRASKQDGISEVKEISLGTKKI